MGSLPSFQGNSNIPHPRGFYTGNGWSVSNVNERLTIGFVTEFEMGLELNSTEVQGILIYEGQDWGHIVLDSRA